MSDGDTAHNKYPRTRAVSLDNGNSLSDTSPAQTATPALRHIPATVLICKEQTQEHRDGYELPTQVGTGVPRSNDQMKTPPSLGTEPKVSAAKHLVNKEPTYTSSIHSPACRSTRICPPLDTQLQTVEIDTPVGNFEDPATSDTGGGGDHPVNISTPEEIIYTLQGYTLCASRRDINSGLYHGIGHNV